ncbi:MAG: DUF2569 family protein [Candidatus Lokiarchaeota archaeon]|nr:DUF2569 family protein [Candidatus Lokiarchaeota archaeon]
MQEKPTKSDEEKVPLSSMDKPEKFTGYVAYDSANGYFLGKLDSINKESGSCTIIGDFGRIISLDISQVLIKAEKTIKKQIPGNIIYPAEKSGNDNKVSIKNIDFQEPVKLDDFAKSFYFSLIPTLFVFLFRLSFFEGFLTTYRVLEQLNYTFLFTTLPFMFILFIVYKTKNIKSARLTDQKPAFAGIYRDFSPNLEKDKELPQGNKSESFVDPELRGIGGWLVLPAIGLIVMPIVGFGALIMSFSLFPEVVAAGYGDMYAMELVANAGLLVFAIYAATWFFKKKSNAPSVIIRFLWFSIGLSILLLIIEILAKADEFAAETALQLFRDIIAAVIWIPYFSVSKRVKATFVN